MTAKEFLPHLEAFIKTQLGIESAWNGEDDFYYLEGDRYHEEDAHIAADRRKAAEALRAVLLQDDL